MRLTRLRHQLLIAMGVPACWTGQPAPAAAPPPRPPAEAAFDAAACPRDSIPETVCGTREEELSRCGPHGDSLASLDDLKLHVTSDTGEPRTFRRFALDGKATAHYRAALDADGLEASEHCCYSRCTPLSVGRAEPPAAGRGLAFHTRCIPYPPGGTSVPSAEDAACPAGVRFDGALRAYDSTEDRTCCYAVPSRRPSIQKGRPARIDGEARFADVGAGAAWRAPGLDPAVDALPRALRDRLAAAWLEAAREEHASIAAFANLSLRLLALGAPPDLIADTHAAALDEIRHAQLSFELASAYAGAPLAPVRFADAARMSAAGDLASLALETLLDGCINETVAAALADEAGATASDPAVAAALRAIAADEARHAALAWRIVAWCVQSGAPGAGADLLAALHATAAQAAADADAPTAAPPAAASPPAAAAVADSRDDLAAHGVLGERAIAATRAGVLREIVAPCLAALAA